MIKSSHKMYPAYFLLDVILIVFTFFILYFVRYKDTIFEKKVLFCFNNYIILFSLWCFFIIFSFYRKGLYSTDRSLSIPKEIALSINGIFYSSIFISSIIFFGKHYFFSRLVFLVCFIMLCFLLAGWRILKRIILRQLIQNGFHNINVLIIGSGYPAQNVLDEIRKNHFWGFNVVGFLDEQKNELDSIPYLGKLKDFSVIVKKYFVEDIIITIPSERKPIAEMIQQAKRLLLGIRIVPDDFEEPKWPLKISYLGIIPILTYKERNLHPAELFLKRLFDFSISLILIILLFPLFVIVGAIIKFSSDGPVFYIQKRIGLKGKEFNLYKFRSMIKDADEAKLKLWEKNEVKDGIIFKIKNDPRITSFGRFLRNHSIDELPQLLNVLKGEMSLVGPRPPTKDEVEKYSHIHMGRLSIRPGVTGLSQIRGRSELTFRKWVKWDLWYINNWSFVLDLKIILLTIPAVFKGDGAY